VDRVALGLRLALDLGANLLGALEHLRVRLGLLNPRFQCHTSLLGNAALVEFSEHLKLCPGAIADANGQRANWPVPVLERAARGGVLLTHGETSSSGAAGELGMSSPTRPHTDEECR